MLLIITEKATAATKVAKALGVNNSFKFKKFTIHSNNTNTLIFGVSGHVYFRQYSKEYEKWNSIQPIQLLNKPILKIVSDKTLELLLKDLIKEYNVTELALFTDYDSEGELIAKDILEIASKFTKFEKVFRFKVSSLVATEVKKAVSNPDILDGNLATAAEVKHIIDLQFGAILTRSLTLNYMKNLKIRFIKQPLSIGRVQTPLLRYIGDLHSEIKNFVPEPYYSYKLYTKEGYLFTGSSKEHIDIQNQINFDNLKTSQKCVIKKQPKPMNSVDLMKLGSNLKFNSMKTMQVAERLYLKGLITYPRTDSRYLDPNISKELLENLKKSELTKYLDFTSEFVYDINQGKADSAHPSILPTIDVAIPEINEEKELYLSIVDHFLKVNRKEVRYTLEKYYFEFKDLEISYITHKLIEKGWLNYNPNYNPITTKLHYQNLEVSKELTKPPSPYSNANIISLMERLKLGTKSTRHTFLPLLKQRGYVLQNNLLSNLGETVYNVIKSTEVGTADLTKDIEVDLNEISEGKISDLEIVNKYKVKIKNIEKELVEHVSVPK